LRYKLTEAGIAARNELLCLLDIRPELDGSFNVLDAHDQLKPKRAKNRATTFGDLLAHQPYYSVALGEINDFFAERLENIVDRYKGQCHSNCAIHDDTLSKELKRGILIADAGLREYFYHYYENNTDKNRWQVSKHFYTPCDTVRPRTKKVQSKTRSTRNTQAVISINPAQEIADLLWDLDYCHQQQKFIDKLKAYSTHAIAFSIAAPKPNSELEGSLQEWLLCRLYRSIDLLDYGWNSRWQEIQIEPPECKSGSTGWGLVEICQQIEPLLIDNGIRFSSNKPDDIIDALAKYSIREPVLIQVRNLHREQDRRKIIIDVFWHKLIAQVNKIQLSRATRRSRLIMFLLEENNSPLDEGGSFYPLPKLDVNFADIDNWACPQQVRMSLAKCDEWNDDIDRQIDEQIDKEIRGWPCWREPRIEIKLAEVFNNLCHLFNSGYGSKHISEYWRTEKL
jgi:hypothetical protein